MDPERILTEHAFKRTPLRIELLRALAVRTVPVRIEALQKELPDADLATLYRALDAFVEAGIVDRAEFQHGHAHYELAYGRSHHHHLICKGCGRIADVAAPRAERLNSDALRQVKGFAVVDTHSLEFFGLCTTCV